MREITGNLFDHIGTANIICITTNGFVKANGKCVMGRGCAKEATRRWPGIAKILGDRIKDRGNTVHGLIRDDATIIASFPVKPVYGICKEDRSNVVRHMQNKFKPGDKVPGWACVADPMIIETSAQEIAEIVNRERFKEIILPRPGCGAGELNWADIKPLLDKYLDDRFAAITFK